MDSSSISAPEAAITQFTKVVGALPLLPDVDRATIQHQLEQLLHTSEIPRAFEVGERVRTLSTSGILSETREALAVVDHLDGLSNAVDTIQARMQHEQQEKLPQYKLLRRFERLVTETLSRLEEVSEPSFVYGCSGMEISDSQSERMQQENESIEAGYHSDLRRQERYKSQATASMTGIILNPAIELACQLPEFNAAFDSLDRYQKGSVRAIVSSIGRENEVDVPSIFQDRR